MGRKPVTNAAAREDCSSAVIFLAMKNAMMVRLAIKRFGITEAMIERGRKRLKRAML